MNEDASEVQKRLRARFPDMEPIKKAPSLATVNGIGLSLYGKRDHDGETRSYVKTQWFCVAFIPLIALKAYRVVDAEPGKSSWYFLGRVPLSDFARWWNGVVVLLSVAAVAAIGVEVYTSSPEYAAKVELREADRLLASGDAQRAAMTYHKLVVGRHPVDGARKGLQTALEQCLRSESPKVVASAYRLIARLPAAVDSPTPVVSNAFGRGVALATQFGAKDPEDGIAILDAIQPLCPTNASVLQQRIGFLVRVVAAQPDNVGKVTELALLYESAGQPDEGVKVLLPYREKVGSTEGARILGHHFLGEGKHQDAYKLLHPYVNERIGEIKACSDDYSNTSQRVVNRALADLRNGKAGEGFYQKYDKSSEAEKGEMVDRFIQRRIASDPTCNGIIERMKEANKIVVVALDLGIVQVNRAQQLTDPAARKSELEAAEKTFLSIRSFAEDSEEYRLFLGQVYYWLGRSDEGKELFDKLLKANERAYPTLMHIAYTLREVGEHSQARTLAEEAYQSAQKDEDRFAAASLRSLLRKDDDDEIAWLAKCNPQNLATQIEMNKALGRKAVKEGNKVVAAQFLRKALDAYEGLPKSSATLNNSGLTYFELYALTGNIGDYRHGMALLSEAVSMDQQNSILVANTMHLLQSQAIMDTVRNRLQIDVLKRAPHLAMLHHLYADEKDRSAIYRGLAESESMVRSLVLLDKALLLAPKDLHLYDTALDVHTALRNVDELRKLKQRIATASPDMTERIDEQKRAMDGSKDKENAVQCARAISELESLLQLPAVREHPPTLAYVSYCLVEAKLVGLLYDIPCKLDELIAFSEAAHRASPNVASASALAAVYLAKAEEEMAAEMPPYAAAVKQTSRRLSPYYRVVFYVERQDTFGRALLRNDNVRKVLEIRKGDVQKFPSFPSELDWAMFRNVDPQVASSISRNLKTNEVSELSTLMEWQLNPLGGNTVLSRYWFLRAVGDDKGADEVLRIAAGNGVKLPE